LLLSRHHGRAYALPALRAFFHRFQDRRGLWVRAFWGRQWPAGNRPGRKAGIELPVMMSAEGAAHIKQSVRRRLRV